MTSWSLPETDPIYVTVQPGFEEALERELQNRFSGSRVLECLKGWRVIALGDTGRLARLIEEPFIFSRSWGVLLGPDGSPWESEASRCLFERPFVLQCWHRRVDLPGAREKRRTLIDVELRERELRDRLPGLGLPLRESREPAEDGETVINAIRLEPGRWVWGAHLHRWDRVPCPGGEYPWPDHSVPSRAYLKCREALCISQAAVGPGDQIIELGAAPGGALLALLERGANVIAIDPAELAAGIREAATARGLALRHLKCLAETVDPETFPERVDWLFSDMNVAPEQLLSLARRWLPALQRRGLRGLFLTLKLTDLSFAFRLREVVQELRQEWGMPGLRARQLSQNRREALLYFLLRG